ncbi:hypothetical protein HJC23_007247 [Cyclotella cryptica]|uniref:Uncharacterized protein n=1 Tax=Cyclotella cryptica TaxID=29204 RepID=A0ABD3Q0J2_9STRA
MLCRKATEYRVAKLIFVAVLIGDTGAFLGRPLGSLNAVGPSNENYLITSTKCETIDNRVRPSRGPQQSIRSHTIDAFGTNTKQKQMVIFRPPSRHTYGFVSDPEQYDLPRLELRALINHDVGVHTGFQFVPVQHDVRSPLSAYNEDCSVLEPSEFPDSNTPSIGPKRAKKKLHVKKLTRQVPSLYWIEGDISTTSITKAASRAILTHATCLIDESFHFSEEVWSSVNIDELCYSGTHQFAFDLHLDVIDITNPNISLKEQLALLRKISYLLCNEGIALPIQRDSVTSKDSIVLYHSSQCKKFNTTIHCIHFGQRTSIGPAGTRGAPSQTLRRTHRGILNEYALKERNFTWSFAMEPEIGFLMANLALASTGRHKATNEQRVLSCLDPCCGSGSLLLYSAALGATELVGVDSDPSVWVGAIDEFKRHSPIGGITDSSSKTSLPYPIFIEGDIFYPKMTRESFDAIVCDPPYNIGTPVFINKKDFRPTNHHKNKEPVKLSVRGDLSVSNGDSVQSITLALLRLAGRVLVEGGRIVFFLPAKGIQTSSSVTRYEALMQSVGLTLVFERKQHFSPTFSRWLLCMEKCDR